MNPWFLPQLLGFLVSLVVLTSWINRFLMWGGFFDRKYLPCFAWGWCVYFLIYMLAREFSVAVETIRFIFTGMAIGIPCLAGIWRGFYASSPFRIQKYSTGLPFEKETLLLIGGFMGGMIYVGPYLEFPSDPLYHLSAIQSWETVRWMNIEPVDERITHFAYFINYWLLQFSNISWGDRTGLAIFCAGLQGMLLWIFIRFTRMFAQNKWMGLCGGIASIGLFGTSVFSFYRYYVLADTFFAYLVFLEALVLICAYFLKERFRYLVLLPPLLAFCWQNHRQEVLLLLNAGVGIGVLLTLFRYRTFSVGFRKQMLTFVVLGVILVMLAFGFSKERIISPKEQIYLQKVADNFLEKPMYVIPFSRLNDVLGGIGWLAMIGSAFALLGLRNPKKLTILACLCIWPLIILWNPFAIELMLRKIPASVYYRLIYGSLFWIFLVVFIEYLYHHRHYWLWIPFRKIFVWWKPRYHGRRLGLVFVLSLILIGSTLIPQAPIRGKIPHLLTKVDTQLNGKDLRPAIQYLRKEAPHRCIDLYRGEEYRPVRSYILSDFYINQYLLTTGYFYTISDRWRIQYTHGQSFHSFPNQFTLKWFMEITKKIERKDEVPFFPDVLKKHHICYVALYAGDTVSRSWIGPLSGHWLADIVDIQHQYSEKLFQWIGEYSQHFQLVFQDEAVQIYEVL